MNAPGSWGSVPSTSTRVGPPVGPLGGVVHAADKTNTVAIRSHRTSERVARVHGAAKTCGTIHL
ncbi:hypothetical protein GCM10027184_46910 [Saccharothrix stipae]